MPKEFSPIWSNHLDRFYSKVNKKGKCWIWEGSVGVGGYGKFSVGRKQIRAHRFAYQVFVGGLKQNLVVMHTCDNPSCVNPKHLKQGTQSDNIRDCVKKGRFPDKRGEKHFYSRLTDDEVKQIRRLAKTGASQRTLGKKFNVTHGTIYHILKNNTWKHV